jgi:hypothetical protein
MSLVHSKITDMKWHYLNIAFAVYLLFTILVVILNLLGYITFGYGLGDLFYLIFICLLCVIITTLKLLSAKFDISKMVILFMILAVLVFVSLKLTLLRGVEYSWNGRVFLR